MPQIGIFDRWSAGGGAYYGQDLFYTPEQFGAVGDGVTDDTLAFQAALAAGDHVFASRNYIISLPLVVRANCALTLGGSTSIRGTAAAQNMIELHSYSLLEGGLLELPAAATAAAIYINGDDKVDLPKIKDLKIWGNTNTGIGLHIDVSDPLSHGAGNFSLRGVLDNVQFRELDTAIYVQKSAPATGSWCNAYQLSNIQIWHCTHSGVLTVAGGWRITNLMGQYSAGDVDGWSLEGLQNTFTNVIYYDLPGGFQVFIFSAASGYNLVNFWRPDYTTYISDAGTENRFTWPTYIHGISRFYDGIEIDAPYALTFQFDGMAALYRPGAGTIRTDGTFVAGTKLSSPAINSALPSYANNAAALLGGLVAGDFYCETGTNPLRIAKVY